jgi:hypothetical protein
MCKTFFAKRFTVLEFETKVDAQNVQDLFTNRFRLFRVRDEGRCTKCSGGSESSLHRISFSIVKSLPKRRLLEHTQKDLYSGLPQVKRDSVMHTDECTGGWERWLPAISTRKRSFRKVNTDFGYIHRRKESKK